MQTLISQTLTKGVRKDQFVAKCEQLGSHGLIPTLTTTIESLDLQKQCFIFNKQGVNEELKIDKTYE